MSETNEHYGLAVLKGMPPRNVIPFRDLARKVARRDEMTDSQVKVGIDWLGGELIELVRGQGYRLTAAGRQWRLSVTTQL